VKPRPKTNLLEEARLGLQAEVATAALAVSAIERRIAEYRALGVEAGYELLAAKASLRTAGADLESHDDLRSRSA